MQFERFGPFALFERFRDDWLITSQAQRLFVVASFVALAVTPVFFGWGRDTAKTSIWIRIPLATLGLVGPLAFFFLWVGMWRYWARIDDSSKTIKTLWFIILLFGLFYGSILYNFAVYRPQVRKRLRAGDEADS
jgi:hypothetical protein